MFTYSNNARGGQFSAVLCACFSTVMVLVFTSVVIA
jgi:hypothetical protein